MLLRASLTAFRNREGQDIHLIRIKENMKTDSYWPESFGKWQVEIISISQCQHYLFPIKGELTGD
jgi:hypothetical protein